jgi:hypothetical protein
MESKPLDEASGSASSKEGSINKLRNAVRRSGDQLQPRSARFLRSLTVLHFALYPCWNHLVGPGKGTNLARKFIRWLDWRVCSGEQARENTALE